jgi:hypothetical protein
MTLQLTFLACDRRRRGIEVEPGFHAATFEVGYRARAPPAITSFIDGALCGSRLPNGPHALSTSLARLLASTIHTAISALARSARFLRKRRVALPEAAIPVSLPHRARSRRHRLEVHQLVVFVPPQQRIRAGKAL